MRQQTANQPPAEAIDEARRWAEARARMLYDGKEVRHRSCGVAIAETLGHEPRPYVGLRKGGLTGEGTCGAIHAGVLLLGEVFGAEDPASPATPELIAAVQRYRELWQQRVDRGRSAKIICNDLTGQFERFDSPERHGFCTSIAEQVAGCVAQTIVELGGAVPRTEAPDR
jgi:hypothetical protein